VLARLLVAAVVLRLGGPGTHQPDPERHQLGELATSARADERRAVVALDCRRYSVEAESRPSTRPTSGRVLDTSSTAGIWRQRLALFGVVCATPAF